MRIGNEEECSAGIRQAGAGSRCTNSKGIPTPFPDTFYFCVSILRLTSALVNGPKPTLAKTGRCSPNEPVAAVVY
jgi:hypothetical protein